MSRHLGIGYNVHRPDALAELMEVGGLYRRMVELQSESAQWVLG